MERWGNEVMEHRGGTGAPPSTTPLLHYSITPLIRHSTNPSIHDPRRSVVHLDADAFFASVEQAADPRLRGKPSAVGGEKRGIIASASYEARKFGIYTPMP